MLAHPDSDAQTQEDQGIRTGTGWRNHAWRSIAEDSYRNFFSLIEVGTIATAHTAHHHHIIIQSKTGEYLADRAHLDTIDELL